MEQLQFGLEIHFLNVQQQGPNQITAIDGDQKLSNGVNPYLKTFQDVILQ